MNFDVQEGARRGPGFEKNDGCSRAKRWCLCGAAPGAEEVR